MERLGARDLPAVMFLLRGFMVPMGMTLLVLMEGLLKNQTVWTRAPRRVCQYARVVFSFPIYLFPLINMFKE